MKFELTHFFEGPMDKVIFWLMESPEPFLSPEDLPNVTQAIKLSEELIGEVRRTRMQYCAHSQIPRALQHLIKPEMLTWVDENDFNIKTKSYVYNIIPFYFKGMFSCKGEVKFSSEGPNKTKRIILGEVKLKVPIIGVLFEEQVIKVLKENMTEEYKITSKKVKEKVAAG